MREIVLDTETTGISVKEGHRIVEIACVELENLIPTGKNFIVVLTQKEKFLNKHSRSMDFQIFFYQNKKNFLKLRMIF